MEQLNYNHNPQEFWNYSDLNRVEEWTKYLCNQLNTHGYNIQLVQKTWTAGEYPTPTQLERIRSNINALQDAWFSIPEWRELMAVHRPDGRETINAEQVNAQEWDLQQMHDYLQSMVKAFELKQSGTLFMIAGGVLNAG